MADEICQIAQQRSSTDGHPFLINGDFNGDRRMDYAVLIQYGWLTNADGKPIQPDTYVVVFLNKGLDFEDDIVSRDASDGLQLMRKGDRDYDYEAQHEFVYRNDTIFAGIGMGGTSYLYENGKFRAIITAD